MENTYTENDLKALPKAQLLKFAIENGIEVDGGMKNDDIRDLILAKFRAIPDADAPPGDGTKPEWGGIVDNGEPKFSKEQLLKSQWYTHRRDALTVILEDGKTYSHTAVNKLIGEFMKGMVK